MPYLRASLTKEWDDLTPRVVSTSTVHGTFQYGYVWRSFLWRQTFREKYCFSFLLCAPVFGNYQLAAEAATDVYIHSNLRILGRCILNKSLLKACMMRYVEQFCLAIVRWTFIMLYWNGQLGWTPALGLYLWGREGGREDVRPDVHVTSNVELRNNVGLLLNVDLRNYVISRQSVI